MEQIAFLEQSPLDPANVREWFDWINERYAPTPAPVVSAEEAGAVPGPCSS